jgi:glutamate/tyrosine decarboxylase-like PLP-dependent enzyme
MNQKEHWIRKTNKEIRERVFEALKENVDFRHSDIMGVPASHLDSNVFYDDFPFLDQAPFLSSLVKNPNHIGCHTMGESEEFFKGTQQIERETIELLGVDLFNAKPGQTDGYIASGGTEANIQACWIYRNKLISEGFDINEIAIVCSEDTHYSIPKAANLLNINLIQLPVSEGDRKIVIEKSFDIIKNSGIKAAIAVLNMGTTMFGSVDGFEMIDLLDNEDITYHAHVDGAYGGFIYAVANENNHLCFADKRIDSITIDAHKMLQAPYGTGIFLARKD